MGHTEVTGLIVEDLEASEKRSLTADPVLAYSPMQKALKYVVFGITVGGLC